MGFAPRHSSSHSTLNIQHSTFAFDPMPPANIDFSPVAVTFQAIGTFLLALVLGEIARTFGWRYVRRWAWAWGAMFVAVMAVADLHHHLQSVAVVADLSAGAVALSPPA